MLPEGVAPAPAEGRPADCFFVHPTGYVHAPMWNAPMGEPHAAECLDWCLAHQVSCAPRQGCPTGQRLGSQRCAPFSAG